MNDDLYITKDTTWGQVFNSVLAHLTKMGVDLNSDIFDWYADACFVIDKYVHNKLSVCDILNALDKLSDLLYGATQESIRNFGILSQEDRIMGQIRAMAVLPCLKDKGLTYDEKEALAFCAYYAFCVSRMDDKEQDVVPVVGDFKSFEKIDAAYKWTKENSRMFIKHELKCSGKYGYDINNPINLCSVRESYRFLKAMKSIRGTIVSVDRRGSKRGTNNHIIDIWEIVVDDQRNLENKVLFFNCYSLENEWIAPEGFYIDKGAL